MHLRLMFDLAFFRPGFSAQTEQSGRFELQEEWGCRDLISDIEIRRDRGK